MSANNSRDVLDWFRTWSIGRLDAIGRTDITSNMSLPLTSDVRVQAAVTYVEQIEADAWASVTWDESMRPTVDAVVASWQASMPQAVADEWAAMWVDTDANVKRLLKSVIRMVVRVELAGV